MAINHRLSTAPLFSNTLDLMAELTEDTGTDLILRKRGANQFLGDDAAHHDDQFPEVSGGIVGLNLINIDTPSSSAMNAAHPLGAQSFDNSRSLGRAQRRSRETGVEE